MDNVILAIRLGIIKDNLRLALHRLTKFSKSDYPSSQLCEITFLRGESIGALRLKLYENLIENCIYVVCMRAKVIYGSLGNNIKKRHKSFSLVAIFESGYLFIYFNTFSLERVPSL